MAFPELRRARLAAERGTLLREAPERVALVYPSPYHTGMSSLGFQTMYREIHARPGRAAERAFLPDEDEPDRARAVLTYESARPIAEFPVIAVSLAYELELAGLIEVLELAGIPPLAEDRDERHPVVLVGGPLTFSNPVPVGPFADAVLMGEADETIHAALDVLFAGGARGERLSALARGVREAWVPSLHGDALPPLGQCEDAKLPAFAQITTPNTELRDMFLVEVARGCSRGCTYCVMRRSTNGGMRIVPMDTILERVPSDARRVGLVGAAVSDHPKIAEIVERLADRGCEVGLSSLRPDKLNDRLAAALRRGGYKTLTTAADGASQRLRDGIERRAKEQHFVRAAGLVRAHGFDRLKLYMMVGLPDETDADIDELARFTVELSKIAPLSLGIAPFVSKRNTPLAGASFAGMDVVEARLRQLRSAVRGRVDLRATSVRWAWVEWVLAQGDQSTGLAVLDAVHDGGTFASYKRSLTPLLDRAPSPRRSLALAQP